MKKNLLFLLFLALVAITPAKAFLVTIPDANFRAKLQTLYSTCFVGAQMETTCTGITSATNLNINNLNITNLSGVEYFTSLLYLYCAQNQLTSLPALPASLRVLYCYQNQLTSLPTLPASLDQLACDQNQLTSLPALPASLQILWCYQNQLTSLPTLPASLYSLQCGQNQLTSLPALPASLGLLQCYQNQLTSLPALPAILQFLWCFQNQLTSLPALPASLFDLSCDQNQLTSLPALPAGLYLLACGSNQLTSLPALPAGLQHLFCDQNQLTSLPVLPANFQRLICFSNQLDFADLEAINPKPSVNYYANPQSYKILPATQTLASLGATLTISGGIGGTLNVYQWYKNNAPISGATSATFSIPAVTATDAGVYRCQVTSTYIGVGTTTGVTITSSNVTINICNITINPSLPNTTIGTPYNQMLTQTGLSGVPTWSVSAGTLPAGLSLATGTGVISGTPTTIGTSTFTIQVTDGTCTQTRTYVVVTICPTITFTNTIASNAIINTPYTFNAGVTGNTTPVTYSISPTLLPAGLSFNTASGLISGTPTAITPSATYTVTADQSAGVCVRTQTYTIVTACPTITFTNTNATIAIVNTPYTLNAGATGNTSILTYSVSPALPAGLNINATTGLISGTPTAITPSATYTVTADQSAGVCVRTQTYTIITACPTITFTNTNATIAIINTPYTLNAGATGNTSILTYSVSPALPAGLSINTTTGLISGTPTAITPSATYTVTAEQSAGVCVRTQTYTFAVANCLPFKLLPVANFLPSGFVGVPYVGATISVANPLAGVTYRYFKRNAINWQTGLTLNEETGVISGTPSFSTSINVVIEAVSLPSGCGSILSSYTLVIYPDPTTSIDNSLDNVVKVYPNPSSDDFNVDFGNINLVKSVVRVYDAQGKSVFSSENNTNLMIIPLGNFASGIYLLEIQTEKGRILKRLAKN